MRYFLAITDENGNPIPGGSANSNYPGWFNVEEINLDALLTGTSVAGGSVSTDYGLGVILAGSAAGAAASLFEDVLQGRDFSTVRLIGVDNTRSGSPVVLDLRLDTAKVTNFFAADGLSLTFEADRYTLSSSGFDARGVRISTGEVIWEDGDAGTAGAVAAIAGATSSPPPATASNIPVLPPTKFLMAVDGVYGGPGAAGRPGWFVIDAAPLSVLLEEIAKGTASGTLGLPQFAPIRISLNGDVGLTELLQRTLTGSAIPQIRIEALNSNNGLVYSIDLANVTVVSLEDPATSGFNLELDFQRVAVTSVVPGQAPVSTVYDRVTETAGGPAIPAPVVPTTGTTPVPASSFFIALAGVEGEAGATRPGWFALGDAPTMSFERAVTNPGDPVAVVEVGRVTVLFNSLTAMPDLMASMTSGTALSGATIHGLSGGGSRTYATDFANVRVVSIEQANGQLVATLEFDRFDMVTWHRAANGSLTANPAVSWNSVTDAPAGPVPSVTPPATTVAAATPEAWFLTMDGFDGGVTLPGRDGAFLLDNVSFAAGADGQVVFDLVRLFGFDPTGHTAILGAFMRDTRIAGARLEGAVNVNGQWRTVTQIDLAEIRVAQQTLSSGQLFGIDLSFGQIVTRTLDRNTGAVLSEAGWNAVDGTPFVGPVQAQPVNVAGTAVPAQSWVMLMDGVGGDSTAAGHVNWIGVDGFALDLQRETEPGLASDYLEGGVIDIQLRDATALVDFLNYLRFEAQGSVVLDGLDGAGRVVSKLELAQATVLRVGGPLDTPLVRLGFVKMEVVTPRFNSNGTQAAVESTGYDFVTNSVDFVNPTAAPIAAPSVSVSQYFMVVEGQNGDVQTAQRGGWYRVELGAVDLSRPDIMTEAAPVEVWMYDLGSASDFLEQFNTGLAMEGVLIEGTRGTGASERVVLRLSLGNVLLNGVEVTNDGVKITLKYEAVRVETWANQPGLPNDGYSQFNVDLETGASFNDLLTFAPIGTQGDDMLAGSSFDNTLDGDAGNDSLYGGGGNDTLTGGNGADSLDGGAGVDIATYTAATSRVEVSLAISGPQGTRGAGLDQLTGIEGLIGSAFDDALTGNDADNLLVGLAGKDLLRGEAGNDVLNGSEGADTLMGGLGNDTLQGGDGTDSIWGGDGNDSIAGGNGYDFVIYADATAGVRVSLANTNSQATLGAGTDRISGIEGIEGSAHNDLLTGNTLNNQILGGAGHDRLDGAGGRDILLAGAGNDTLIGGLDADTLVGGTGSDTFVFSAPSGGPDMINDFQTRLVGGEVDTLQITGSTFGLAAGALAAGQVQSGSFGMALTADVRFIFHTPTFLLFYDADGSLGGSAVLLGTVISAGLTAGDFTVI